MTQNRDKATSGGCDDGSKGSSAVRTAPSGPYIITKFRAVDSRDVVVSRRAATTLEGARAEVFDQLAAIGHRGAAYGIAKSFEPGEPIGLPDGTVIEVKPTTRRELVREIHDVKMRQGSGRWSMAELVEALNASRPS